MTSPISFRPICAGNERENNSSLVRFLGDYRAGIESAKVRVRIGEQGEGRAGLDDAARIQYDDPVVVQDGVELVRNGDDGAGAELLADDALHNFVCFGVDAVLGKTRDLVL